MRISEITFSLEKTTPLYPLTGDPADEYANVKPRASCTIEFEKDAPNQPVEIAWEEAREQVLSQLVLFHQDLLALLGKT